MKMLELDAECPLEAVDGSAKLHVVLGVGPSDDLELVLAGEALDRLEVCCRRRVRRRELLRPRT